MASSKGMALVTMNRRDLTKVGCIPRRGLSMRGESSLRRCLPLSTEEQELEKDKLPWFVCEKVLEGLSSAF